MTSRLLPRVPAARDAVEDVYRVTPLQEGMLFHSLHAPSSGAYLNQQSYTLQGELDAGAFRGAFEQMIARHAVLRTALCVDADGSPQQVVYRRVALPWEEHDWRYLPDAEQEARLADLLRDGRQRDFDLASPPLVHLVLIRRRADVYQFIWRYHLMLLDGWSVAVILGEVLALYAASARGARLELPAPPAYRRYIDWLERQDRSRGDAYWQRTLRGFATPTPIGADRRATDEPPAEDVYDELELLWSADETRELRAFARGQRLTPHTVMMGAWALCLARQSGVDDVVFGNVVAGRPVGLAGIEQMVGLFINNIPVRARIAPDEDVSRWLQALQAQQVEARQYEYMSLLDIQRWSDVPRGALLFESVLIFQNYPLKASLDDAGGDLRMLGGRSVERNSFPITVIIEPGPRLLVRLVYDRRRFDEPTARRLVERFLRLAGAIARDPGQRLGDIDAASRDERARMVDAFNQPLASPPARSTGS